MYMQSTGNRNTRARIPVYSKTSFFHRIFKFFKLKYVTMNVLICLMFLNYSIQFWMFEYKRFKYLKKNINYIKISTRNRTLTLIWYEVKLKIKSHTSRFIFFFSIHRSFWIDRYVFQNFNIQLGFSDSKNIGSDYSALVIAILMKISAILFSENSIKDS